MESITGGGKTSPVPSRPGAKPTRPARAHGRTSPRLLTFLRLALSDHEGADLRVRQLQQLLGLVSAEPFEQPAGR